MNRPTDTENPSEPAAGNAPGATPRPEDAAGETGAEVRHTTLTLEADTDATGEGADPRDPDPRDPDGTGDETPRMADDPGVTDDWREPEAEPFREPEAEPEPMHLGQPEPDPEPEPEIEPEPESAAEHRREPEPEARAAPEPANRDERDLPDEEEDHGMGMAGRLLVLLIVAIVAGIGALYAAPKLAPHVPAGVAKYLVPGQPDAQARIDALAASLAATESRLAAVEGELGARAGQDALLGVADALAALEARVSEIETGVSALGRGAEDLAGRVEALASAPPPAAAADGAPAAEQARSGELARLEEAVRTSALERALAELSARARGSSPFAAELDEAEAVSGQPAPAALRGIADTGVPSTGELARSISEPARAALAADIRANAGDGMLGQLGAWARSQVVARPTVAREGEDVASVLSRVGARLEAGDAASAEAEAAALPDHARAAMGGWLDALAARAAADAALAEWIATLGAKG